ncbi:MAG: ribonuclease P protein component [Methylophilaceae bacterium]
MPKLVVSKLVMLRKTDEFSSVFSFRKRFASNFLVTYYKPNEIFQLRIGFIVAKKTAKLAVDRNYMRRVLRELCRQELPVLGGADVVIQVQKPFSNRNFLQIKKELTELLSKIKKKLVKE